MKRQTGLQFATAVVAFGAQLVAAQPGVLEEVMVYAEKRETNKQNTPIAVSAFSQRELDRQLINNTMDVQAAVPNMLMSKDFFLGGQISIRGVGSLGVGSTTDQSTGVHFNGVYLTNSRVFEAEYFDTERIEVLRGPQGTLYGRNTTAGVVNVLTQRPEADFGGFIDASYGDYDYIRTRGALNFPITDNLWQRFSVFYTERDGYVDNNFNGDDVDGRDMYALRSSTTWHFGDSSAATLVVNYFEEDSDRLRGSGAYCAKDEGVLGCLPNRGKPNEVFNTGGSVGGFLTGAVGAFTGQPFPKDDMANSINPAGARTVNMDFKPAYETDETIVSLEIEHEFGEYTITSLTGYQESDYDARVDFDYSVASEPWPFPVTFDRGPDGTVTTDRLLQNDRATTKPEQWSQELRLASDFGGDWNFMGGGFWLDYEADNHFTVYSSSLAVYGQTFGIPESQHVFDNEARDVKLETWALFGELYYDINDKTELTLGIRYTDEKKETDQRTVYLNFLADPAAPGGDYLHLEDDWQETTGRVNISYHWSDNVMLYTSGARSYKSGGFNPIDPNSPLLDPEQGGDPGLASFDPEFINSLEIGAKTRFFNNSLQANLTYFYYDYEDLQVSKFVSQTSVNENMDADLQGFEAELIWVPDEHWTLSMNLSWLDTELGNFKTFDPADPNQMGTTEGVISAGNENIYLPCLCPGIEVDVDGNELPNAPEYSAYLTAAYRWFLNNGMQLEVATNYYYQDEFYTRIYNTADDELDSWDTWNASMTLTAESERWYAEGWVRNIGDEDHVTGQQLQDPGAGLYRSFYLLEPRTYGVTVGYSF